MIQIPSLTSFILLCIFAMESIARSPEPLKAVGKAMLGMLFFDIYTSEIKTRSGKYEKDIRPIQLKISYERKITSQTLIQQTIKEWDAQGIQKKGRQAWIKRLEEIWPTVMPSDTLIFEVNTLEENEFFFNGNSIGGVEDFEFGESFLDIWLSPNTTRPKMRRDMIGNY